MASTVVPITQHSAAVDIEADLHLLRAAIDLIVGGGARRVTLVGLADPEHLLPRARALSADAGLAAHAMWHPDGLNCDIAVEDVR